jgi:superfamily II DNA helicase RecQ
VLCLTATASTAVRKDIISILCLEGNSNASHFQTSYSTSASSNSSNSICYIDVDEDQQSSPTGLALLSNKDFPAYMMPPVTFLGDFNRPNLQYSVWPKTNIFEEDIELVLKALRCAPKGSPAIVYCFSQSKFSIYSSYRYFDPLYK